MSEKKTTKTASATKAKTAATVKTKTLSNAAVTKLYKDYLIPGVITYYKDPLPIVSGKGCALFDAEGREYLDFFGGILTVSVGHCNDYITNRFIDQAKRLQHASTLYPTIPAARLAEKLAEITPGNLKRSFFTNSGTEADETAIMMAQHHTGAQEIIALRHCYSGRSAMAMNLTAHSSWRISKTLLPGIKHAHAPYCYRCPFKLKYPSCDIACATDLEELIKTETSGRIAAFIAEPILGVGGFIVPPKEYFKVAVDIVRRNGGVFIADEVQTAWGRTGKHWFGIEHFGVVPEIISSAKGMANGIPIGWTITNSEIADNLKGLTISTFGGNPVSCEAAHATIDFIGKENLLDHTHKVGNHLRKSLEELQGEFPVIGDVRGMGLMVGVELVTDKKSKVPNPEAVLKIFEETKKDGLLIGKGGLYGNVLRISPPMTITKDQIDHALKVLKKAFKKL
ncbi:MAG: aspartate aminotransferase family protein [Candidatus Riflebacteria bacterium]|nr:aspartate aminotransferase family protein [Candidatus Riflebacteria bacterium]